MRISRQLTKYRLLNRIHPYVRRLSYFAEKHKLFRTSAYQHINQVNVLMRTYSTTAQSNKPLFPKNNIHQNTNYDQNYGFLVFLGLSAGLLYWLHEGAIRERDIIRSAIHLDKQDCKGQIVSSEMFIKIAEKPKGDLSGAIVQNKENKKMYLKKGAQSFDTLVKELIYSDFLAMLRPGIQPEALIMQEKKRGAIAQFYSLSEIYPNTVDLEDFLCQTDWRERLMKKPMKGLDVALAIDFMLAKQRDMKLANYIVLEKEDCYWVASIDHEHIGSGPFAHHTLSDGTSHFLKALIAHVNDCRPPGEDNHAGLAGDPKVHEFFDYMLPLMNIDNVHAFYRTVAEVDYQQLIDLVGRFQGETAFLSKKQEEACLTLLFNIQSRAQLFIYQHDKDIVSRPMDISPMVI